MRLIDYIVLGVIAAGGAFAYPVIRDAMKLSRESSCTSNLLEVSRASLIYADDYDHILPPIYTYDSTSGDGEKLLGVLHEYLGHESKFCPEDKPAFRKYESGTIEGTGPLGYVHDSSLTALYDPKQPGRKLINLDQVSAKEEVLFFRDPIREILTRDNVPHIHSPHGDRFMSSNLEGRIRRVLFDGSKFTVARTYNQGS
jgi:hypothetical protein